MQIFLVCFLSQHFEQVRAKVRKALRAANTPAVHNGLSQHLVRYCSVEDATSKGTVCCRW